MTIDNNNELWHNGGVAEISAAKFDRLMYLGGRKPTDYGVAFFMSAQQRAGQILRGFTPADFLDCRSINLVFSLLFSFDRDKTGYSARLGVPS